MPVLDRSVQLSRRPADDRVGCPARERRRRGWCIAVRPLTREVQGEEPWGGRAAPDYKKNSAFELHV